MTVCLASDGFPPRAGGVVSFNWHLTRLLVEGGHFVVQLNIDRLPNAPDRVSSEGLFTQVWLGASYRKYYRDWQRHFSPGGMDAPDWIAIGLAMREWLLENAKRYAVDVVEASDFGGYGAFLSDKNLPPLLLTGHAGILQLSRFNHYPPKEESYQLLRRLESLAYAAADALIAHSRANAAELKVFNASQVFETLMPWTMSDDPATLDEEKEMSVLAVGALQPVKGVEELVKAVRILKRQGIAIPVTWLGHDTFHSPRIYSLAAYLAENYPDEWATSVQWLNGEPHASVLQRIRESAIVAMPSLFETFGYTVLEAAQYGKAIVLTDAVGAAQHFVNEQSALVVPAGNADALADAIRRLHSNKELRESLGKEARLQLQKQFVPSRIVEQRIAAYQQVMDTTSERPKGFEKAMAEISPYHTPQRRLYFRLRALGKKTLRKGSN